MQLPNVKKNTKQSIMLFNFLFIYYFTSPKSHKTTVSNKYKTRKVIIYFAASVISTPQCPRRHHSPVFYVLPLNPHMDVFGFSCNLTWHSLL